MDTHTFINKRKVGSTDICDFTDYQGIGRDPLYKRYDSVYSIIKKTVAPHYAHFLAAPDYSANEDVVNWYIDTWADTPVRLTELNGKEYEKYRRIKEDTINHYKEVLNLLSGEELQVMTSALRYLKDDFIFCVDDKVYVVAWGMTPDPRKHISKGELVHDAPMKVRYRLTFDAGEYGTLISKLDHSIAIAEGTVINENIIPSVTPKDGYVFKGWSPEPLGITVDSDMTFTAQYIAAIPPVPPMPLQPPTPRNATCNFNAGNNGTLQGSPSVIKTIGSRLTLGEIPIVSPKKGYDFKGWDINPLDFLVKSDTTFNAVYEKKEPWYKRLWLWMTGSGWLKWLLWLLLGLLLILLLSWLLPDCHGCSREVNGVNAPGRIEAPGGEIIDDNGVVTPIDVSRGILPDESVVIPPIREGDGAMPPIERNPGVPPVIANRLILFLENEQDNIDALAVDFKKAYPGDQYSIIGYDRDVKSLVIQIPESERDEIRKTINTRIPNHQFIVFDEEIYELNGHVSDTSVSDPGWHLKAVHAQEGWAITKGSPSVTVAIVDDGIDASHPIFKGRIINAYNVFTKNNQLSNGDGHGTHTAGLAVGSQEFLSQGASGIAPNCKLMPIQVIDNKLCPLSALISGIMYAIHKGADVVNMSIGPSFQGLNQLPVELQNEIAETQFKNVEQLWNRVCKLASAKNTILVFAAGNDDILSSIPPENRSSIAITVGAVDQKLYPTDFTNYGPCTDISAPGKEIYSSYPVKDFKSFDGTSMAAPIVAGTVALMKSLKKDINVRKAYNVLYKSGKDVYGYMPPMVQVDLALEAVKRGDFSDPEKRLIKSVPDIDIGSQSGAMPPSSWTKPEESVIVVDESRLSGVKDEGSTVIPEKPQQPPVSENESNYDAIRRQIEMYKQKIKELEEQLPENKRK